MRIRPRAACQNRSNKAQRRSQQIFRRVHPAARMADEWPLKMDSEREGSTFAIVIILSFAISFAFFDRIRQPFECPQSRIHRSA